MVWRKSNPMPNFRGRRFTNAHETMIWATRDQGARYTFNYEALKAGNEDIQVRSDWTLPLCTGEERLKGRDGKKLHPTQKPEALLARVILASSRPDDLVLDPFNGTGTTGAVATHLGRRYIGIERDPAYAKAAEKRIAAVKPLEAPSLAPFMTAREAPRVAFASLIERGMISAGAKLVDAKKKHKVLVRADGAVALGDAVGSIHRIGALAQGPRRLQRLDLLASRDAEGPRLDRRAARRGPGGDGRGLNLADKAGASSSRRAGDRRRPSPTETGATASRRFSPPLPRAASRRTGTPRSCGRRRAGAPPRTPESCRRPPPTRFRRRPRPCPATASRSRP